MSFYTRFQFPTPYFFSFFFFNFLTSSSSVALSYAALANLPPVLGLYAAIIPSACYSFLGSSMQVGTSRRRWMNILSSSLLIDITWLNAKLNMIMSSDIIYDFFYNSWLSDQSLSFLCLQVQPVIDLSSDLHFQISDNADEALLFYIFISPWSIHLYFCF